MARKDGNTKFYGKGQTSSPTPLNLIILYYHGFAIVVAVEMSERS